MLVCSSKTFCSSPFCSSPPRPRCSAILFFHLLIIGSPRSPNSSVQSHRRIAVTDKPLLTESPLASVSRLYSSFLLIAAISCHRFLVILMRFGRGGKTGQIRRADPPNLPKKAGRSRILNPPNKKTSQACTTELAGRGGPARQAKVFLF
ncbi:hypothetical protein PIB30_033293 [Stylosanthes scabra]|uniref:Uncharacterized protein n=1 Tax=Stylosanthes scabra TaxID=79078 RepID=A0ABU6SC55_9FABA|nr:hypothetical protein [Stylosanthes scabra]